MKGLFENHPIVLALRSDSSYVRHLPQVLSRTLHDCAFKVTASISLTDIESPRNLIKKFPAILVQISEHKNYFYYATMIYKVVCNMLVSGIQCSNTNSSTSVTFPINVLSFPPSL